MLWRRGLQRIYIAGGITTAAGAAILLSALLSQQNGYLPNPVWTQIYLALWPVSLLLVVIGLLLLALPWVLRGFLPADNQLRAKQ